MIQKHDQHKGRTRKGGRKHHEKQQLANEYFSVQNRPVLSRMWAISAMMRRDANLMVRVSYTDRKKARMELEEL